MTVCLFPSVSSMECSYAILSSTARPALQYFPILPHKRHEFQNKLLNIKRVFYFLYNFYLKHFSF